MLLGVMLPNEREINAISVRVELRELRVRRSQRDVLTR